MQALTHDVLLLAEAYEKCQISAEAMIAARALLIERQRTILEEIAAANAAGGAP